MKASSPKDHTILGHDIPKAKLTPSGWVWGAVYLGLPVILLGNLMDFFSNGHWVGASVSGALSSFKGPPCFSLSV
jgi:hypothetical protein